MPPDERSLFQIPTNETHGPIFRLKRWPHVHSSVIISSYCPVFKPIDRLVGGLIWQEVVRVLPINSSYTWFDRHNAMCSSPLVTERHNEALCHQPNPNYEPSSRGHHLVMVGGWHSCSLCTIVYVKAVTEQTCYKCTFLTINLIPRPTSTTTAPTGPFNVGYAEEPETSFRHSHPATLAHSPTLTH